jgi:hypothetical protein
MDVKTLSGAMCATFIESVVILALGLLFVTTIPQTALAQQDSCGDVNGDGSVTTVDSLMVLRTAVGVPVEFNCPVSQSAESDVTTAAVEAGGCGDVNGDGRTTTVDALMILQYAIGIPLDFQCAAGPTARNLIRYLNNLVCKGEVFKSTVTVEPSGEKWTSKSGVTSDYKPWNSETIGSKFIVTTGECGEVELFGTINLTENTRWRMVLGLGGFFNDRLELSFQEEGPISSLASGFGAEQPANLRGFLPEGVTLRRGND